MSRASSARDLYSHFLSRAGSFLGGRWNSSNPEAHDHAMAVLMYRRVLSELAINRFKWSGLPDSVDPRFLEVTLFQNALSVFYYDMDPNVNAFLALEGGGTGRPNMMDNPTAFRVFRNPLPTRTYPASMVVPIWANTSRTPDLDIVNYYAARMARWDTTLEINAINARQTKIVASDENGRLSAQNFNKQVYEGVPTIYVNTGSDLAGNTSVLDLGIDLMGLEKLSIVRSRIWSECMNMLGINGASTEKKERVVQDEVSQNDDQVQSARNVALNERQRAAYMINQKWGLSVSVDFKSDLDGVLDSADRNTYSPSSAQRDAHYTEFPGDKPKEAN